MKMTTGHVFVGLTLLFAVAGCAKPGAPPGKGAQDDGSPLNVAAASDLRAVLPQIVARYEGTEANHKSKVVVTFGASGQLAEGIKAGGPFDLFMSANEAFVSELAVDDKYVQRSTVRRYAVGSIVLAVHSNIPEPTKAETAVAALEDLLKPEVKHIALANPKTAPYGAAGKQALVRAGLWEKLEPKIVYAENIVQALQFVQTGNAEAGIVSRSSTQVVPRPNLEAGTVNRPTTLGGLKVVEVDAALYDPIIQSLGVVTRSKKRATAEDFVRFLMGEEGRAAFESHGFKPPPAVNAGAGPGAP